MALKQPPLGQPIETAGHPNPAWLAWFNDLFNQGTTARVNLEEKTSVSGTELEFKSNINVTYNRYMLYITNMQVSADQVDLHMRLSKDTGLNYLAGTNYKWGVKSEYIESGGMVIGTDGSTSDSKIQLNNNTLGSAFGERINGVVEIYDPSDSTVPKQIKWDLMYKNSSGNIEHCTGVAESADANAVDGIKLYLSNGQFSDGDVVIYGLK